MHEQVTGVDGFEHRNAGRYHRTHRHGRILERRITGQRQRLQAAQVQQAVHHLHRIDGALHFAVDRIATQVVENQRGDVRWHRGFHLHAHRRVVRPAFRGGGDRREQVMRVIVMQVQVTAARDAEQVRAVHDRIRVEQVCVRAEHVLDGDHGARPPRHRQQARHVARQFMLGQMRARAALASIDDRDEEPEVRQVRQRHTGAERHRER